MKKTIIRVVIALVVLAIIAVIGIALSLDSIVKKAVETVGPQITKVSVKLDGVGIHLFAGSGKIKGLVIGNPEGCKTPYAISLGSASASLSPGSVFSDKIVIHSVVVESPEINFEGGLKDNNLTKILANLNSSVSGGATEKSSADPAKPAKKLQVDELIVRGAKVNVSLTTLGMTANIPTLTIPEIHLTDLGKNPEGITAADLSKRVLTEVIDQATKQVATLATDIGKGALKSALEGGKNITNSAAKALKGVGDLFKK